MLDEDRLVQVFNEIADWVYEQAGIECPCDTIRFEVYENNRGGVSAEGRVGYRGPLQRRGDSPRIKLDLTSDELLVLEPTGRDVHHPYSDRPDGGIRIQCYCYEEVFAEKIRALAERERPRDLYDAVHLYRHESERPDRVLFPASDAGRKPAAPCSQAWDRRAQVIPRGPHTGSRGYAGTVRAAICD